MSPATPVPARLVWKELPRVHSTGPSADHRDFAASSETRHLVLASTCVQKTCHHALATIEVAYRPQAGKGALRLLVPSPSVPGVWTDPSNGHSVSDGLVHAARLQAGFGQGEDQVWTLTKKAREYTQLQSQLGRHRVDAPVTMHVPAQPARKRKGIVSTPVSQWSRFIADPDDIGTKPAVSLLEGHVVSKFPVTIRCICGVLIRLTVPVTCDASCEWHGTNASRPSDAVLWRRRRGTRARARA